MTSTVVSALTHESDPVKGSRFICTIAPAAVDGDAREAIDRSRTQFPDASHHCSAWRLAAAMVERTNDDGEPGGAAGRPMLARLVGRDVIDVVAVVARYFGGTKLGVGGLVRAYGRAVGHALDRVTLVPHVVQATAVISHRYEEEAAVDSALRLAGAVSLSVGYGTSITRTVQVPAVEALALDDAVRNATSGRIEPVWL